MDYNKIKLVILDVDGTLTDGGIYYDSQGNEMKRFSAKDGLGIMVARRAGLELAIITGRASPMVERRAKELGIQHLLQGVQQKFPALTALIRERGLSLDEIGYIGDDLNDLQCMETVGFCACPADAAKEVKAVCQYVASVPGGHGAVREGLEYLLVRQERWEKAARDAYYV
jgi:3-deoxy-D-manno-octulosonate 8-phosphate phosphatase (KDO 8-P phosphatase)